MLYSPIVLGLEILPKIPPVDLETYVGDDVSLVSVFVDSDRYFGCRDVLRCGCWFWSLLASCGGESIDVYIEFCVCRELFVFLPFVLVSFNPLGLEGSSEFFI